MSAVAVISNDKASAFEREALSHLDSVYRVALSFVGDPVEAEDLTQETMLKAYRAWDQYRLGTNVRAWLLTILRNEVFSAHRRRKRASRLLDTWRIDGITAFNGRHQLDPEDRFFDEFVDDEVVRAIQAIPIEFREAVVLRYVEDLSYAEIAQVAGVPIGTVKSRLSRGRRLLKRQLQDYAVEMGLIAASGK